LFFNNLGLCHIESSGSQLSLFSLSSTISLLWTQFRASVDTTWTPRWTPKSANPTTKFSVSDEPAIWCPPPRSQRLHLFESHAIDESVDLAHEIFNRVFRKASQRIT
jgi:hypothetical protein